MMLDLPGGLLNGYDGSSWDLAPIGARSQIPDETVLASLLKVLTSEKAYLLDQPAQPCMPLVHSGSVLLFIGAAIVPPGQVNELADCRGEIQELRYPYIADLIVRRSR